MINRNSVLSNAIDECMKEIYSLVQPQITWEEFKEECKIYSEKYKKEESECTSPAPCEFYFLPREIIKDICDSYVHAYKIDNQQELLDTIETLKNYCKEPIVDKYIDDWTDETGFHHPGYRSYDHPDNLSLCLMNLITDSNLNLGNNTGTDIVNLANKLQDKFFEFLDMAGNFYNWNRDLNSFNISVYLGPSPNSNKEVVIENWKKYRNQDIEIDEEQIKEDYYGEELD